MEELPQKKTVGGSRINLIWVGCGFGLFYWILESVRDVLAFGKGTLPERLFYPDLTSVWTRLLIIALIIFYGFYAQSLRANIEQAGVRRPFGQARVIISGLMFAVLYWVLEAARDVFIFHKGRLLDQLVAPDVASLSVRMLAVSVLVLFSIYVQNLINERWVTEEAMREKREELERMVSERTAELSTANELLRLEVDGRKRLEAALWVSRRSFHDVANAVSDGILILDLVTKKVRFANSSAASLLGKKAEEMMDQVLNLPVAVGQKKRLNFTGAAGPVLADVQVLETEWQGSAAYLAMLSPVPRSAHQPPGRII